MLNAFFPVGRNPGGFRSVWLLHTTLRNEVNKQKPLPGETVYLRYQGLQKPKSGGDEYHSWKLVVDRDETRNPSFLPWEGPQDPRTEAEAMVPHSTGPATQSEQAAPWNEPEPSTDEIPF